MSTDPYVIRSQRNNLRKPVPQAISERAVNNPNGSKDGSKGASPGLDCSAQSRLRMVRKKHHLGYVSTS